MSQQLSRNRREEDGIDFTERYTNAWGQNIPWFKNTSRPLQIVCVEESPLAPREAPEAYSRFHHFHADGGPQIALNQSKKCKDVSEGTSE